MYPKLLIDILGWTGSILYLLAYALIFAKKTEGMNIFAGSLPVIYTLALGASAMTGLNAVWVAIGLSTGLLRLFTLGWKWLTRN